MARLLVMNGPNLNLLGKREQSLYGTTSLADVEAICREWGEANQFAVDCFQSNAEHALIERIHQGAAYGDDPLDGIVLNAGALTHTSIALRDALVGAEVPFVEVHISNVHAREPFRHHSYMSDVAAGIVVGMGTHGYISALNYFKDKLSAKAD